MDEEGNCDEADFNPVYNNQATDTRTVQPTDRANEEPDIGLAGFPKQGTKQNESTYTVSGNDESLIWEAYIISNP